MLFDERVTPTVVSGQTGYCVKSRLGERERDVRAVNRLEQRGVGGKECRGGSPVTVLHARDIQESVSIDVNEESSQHLNVSDQSTFHPLDNYSPSITRSVDSENKVSITKQCSFLHWNVDGLASKINDFEFVSFVRSFDFVSLVETFLDDFKSDLFPGHTIFCKPAIKFTKQGRRSGGIVCLVNNDIRKYVKLLNVDYENVLALRIDKCVLKSPKDVLFICAYIPPEGSPFYSFFDVDNGVACLEDCLAECLLTQGDVSIILAGDLNSRIADCSPLLITDNVIDSLHDSMPASADKRCSEDKVTNSYGKLFLNLCTAFSLTILIGMWNGDRQGRYTFISDVGCSVNDFFVLSYDLASLFVNNSYFSIIERIESPHMPLKFTVFLDNKYVYNSQERKNVTVIEKFCWQTDYEEIYKDNLNSLQTQTLFDKAIDMIDFDINNALDIFNEAIRACALCMRKRIRIDNNGYAKSKNWFDNDCVQKRKEVRRLLRRFRKSLNTDDRNEYCVSRREYKHLLNHKKKCYMDGLLNKLTDSIHNQQEFWNTMRKISGAKRLAQNNISMENWFSHFKTLLEKPVASETDNVDINVTAADNDAEYFAYDRPITKEEILLALRRIKRNKSSGPDGIIGEFLKTYNDDMLNFFVNFFNCLFDKGIYPDNWTESVLLPLYKKGDINSPGNYRGISLSDILSKLYGSIINSRLQEWVDLNEITGEHQAGFKKGYSTIDHLFTLLACVRKEFSVNRKFYVAFIDFEKAFESLRNLL